MVSILQLSTYMRLISTVFHPTFMPIYAFLSIWQLAPHTIIEWSEAQQLYFFILLLLGYTILPALFVYNAYRLGWISTLNVAQHERRLVLLLIATWYMLTTAIWIKWISLPYVVLGLLNTGTALLFALWVMNFMLKVSAHAAGTAAVAAYCIIFGIDSSEYSLFRVGVFLIACTGLVISSRIYLKSHQPSEAYTGAAIGLSVGAYIHTF